MSNIFHLINKAVSVVEYCYVKYKFFSKKNSILSVYYDNYIYNKFNKSI